MPDKHIIDLKVLENGKSKLGVVSLPVPSDADYEISVRGTRSQSVPVGFWPRTEDKPGGKRRTRRSLLFFEKPADSEPQVELVHANSSNDGAQTSSGWDVQAVAIEDVARHSDEKYFHYLKQPGEAKLSYKGKESAFSLAIQNDTGMHLWQYVQAERLWRGPLVEAWRIGGHIYTSSEEPLTQADLKERGNIINDLKDDTVAASVYLLLFADGTVQVTAHWINGRIYGGVGDQNGCPVVLFNGVELPETKWDGANTDFTVDGVKFDFSKAADLVSEEHPGEFRKSGYDSVWKPFEDTRIVIRHKPVESGVEDVEVDGSADGLVQGASRSVTWNMGLSQESAVSLGRYIAPPQWYADCCEFAPFPIELKDGEFDDLGRVCAEALLRNSVTGKFTSGGIFRYLDMYGKGAYELSMDANEGRSLFRRAYRDTDGRFFDIALRNSYFMADIATDHSRDIIHYHGDYPNWKVYSLIYQRFSGMVFGYLETGDFYLLETAEAVARNYMSHHMQNWPRRGIGRDADPLTGFMTLWDYTGKEEFFSFARDFARHVSLVINEKGEWHSGSGVGPLMGCNALLGSAWNGGHFLHGFTEYAMRDPEIPQEQLENARRGLSHLYDVLYKENNGYHPASSGFVGRIHWYLACRLGDRDLIDRTHDIMNNVLKWAENPGDGLPIFTGGRGHHQNNYIDNLIFYQATKDCLPDMVNSLVKEAV